MTRCIVRGGRLVDPSQGIDERLDVLIEDGVIAQLEENIEPNGKADILDATGLVVTPGLIDMHVHLREPGFEYKETVATGVLAAAAGGFTAIACMADTDPVHDNRAVTELILREAKRHPQARVYPIGATSRGRKGEELAEIGEMKEAGIVAVSDSGRPLMNATLLRHALEYTRHFDLPVIVHAEDLNLTGDAVMHEGEFSTRLGLPGMPGFAEDVMVARDLCLLEDSLSGEDSLVENTGGRYHLAHLSTGRSLEMIREARGRGIPVTCEVTPQHLLLTDRDVMDSGFSTSTKIRPPLRSQSDTEALLAGLADGTVDVIASDHSPHHPVEKDVQFSAAPFGVVGLETTVSLCLDRLVGGGVISLSRLVELLSTGPARVLSLPGGSLAPGRPADLTLLDLERQVTVDPDRFRSKSRNTPFGGWTLRGGAVGTIVGGQRVELP